jgi:bacterioferritin-associated ferredoxin
MGTVLIGAVAVYVCLCNGITERDIQRAAAEGCSDMDTLTMRTGCASTCGCCRDVARQVLDEARSASFGLNVLPMAA